MTIPNTVDEIKAPASSESGTSQAECANAVEKLARKIGQLPINPTAKLVAFVMRSTRVVDTKALAQITGLSMRVIQKSKNEYATASDECSESSEPGFANRTNPANQDSPSPSPRVHAPAQIELPSEVDSTTVEVLSPPTPSAGEARVGESHAGHGVFVNCETIRHKAFSISLPGIRMGVLASGLSADDIKTKCVAHALQWAAEIENGKRPDGVVPAKIANFLSASIMGEQNRAAVAGVRMSKAAAAAPARTTSLRQVLNDAKAAREAGAAA